MKNYGKGKRVLPISKRTEQDRKYRAKNSKNDAYKNERYTPEEREMILSQKDPLTGEHLTKAEIAKRLNRTYSGIAAVKRDSEKMGIKRKMPSDETFAFVGRLI